MAKKKVIKKEVVKKNRLSKEQYFEMTNFHLRRDIAKQELKTCGVEIENLERAKQLATLRRNDVKSKLQRLEHEYDGFLTRLAKEGIDIRNKTIDTETYEVLDI